MITDARLLECGFAGDTTPDELDYIIARLRLSETLRRAWGLKPRHKMIPRQLIAFLAMRGNPDSERDNRILVRQWRNRNKPRGDRPESTGTEGKPLPASREHDDETI